MHKEISGPNATPVFALEELETSRIREKTDPENSPIFSTLKKNVSQLSIDVVLSNRELSKQYAQLKSKMDALYKKLETGRSHSVDPRIC